MNEGMQNLKEIEDLENKLKNRYSIAQILDAWEAAYGEDMMTEYPGFIQRLSEENAPQDSNPVKGSDINKSGVRTKKEPKVRENPESVQTK
tara:strand:- start:403 stop:675 length:273 start_codon:yes stop_codon:yes gene_type:complete